MKNIFAIYKPKGPTSHDIIDEIRRVTGVEKVGHAGTLDPLARGILVVGVGREATKKLAEIVRKEKEYVAVVKLGEESTTDDEEGEKIIVDKFSFHLSPSVEGENKRGGGVKKYFNTPPPRLSREAGHLPSSEGRRGNHPSLEDMKEVMNNFRGKIMQTPPVYSAVKIHGKPAHRLARQGKDVKLKPREVEIKEIEILEYEWPFLKIRVVTGPGVYIRSLARDIGRELGVGGYLKDLERVRVGEFTKRNALTIEQFTRKFQITNHK